MVTGGRGGQRLTPIAFPQTPDQKAMAQEQVRALAANREKQELGGALGKYMDDYLGEKQKVRDEVRLVARENVKSERENAQAYRTEGFVAARQVVGLSGMLESVEADADKWLATALGKPETRQTSWGAPGAAAAGQLLKDATARDTPDQQAKKIAAIRALEIPESQKATKIREYKFSQVGDVEVPEAVWEKVKALQAMRITSTNVSRLTQEQKDFYLKTRNEIVVLMQESMRKKRRASMAYYETLQRMTPRHTGQERHLASLPPLEELLAAEEAIARRTTKPETPGATPTTVPGRGESATKPPPTGEEETPETPETPEADPAPRVTGTLKLGSSGRLVRNLQRQLNKVGLLAPTLITGKYDENTEAAVKALQARSGIKVDGAFGKRESAPALKLLLSRVPTPPPTPEAGPGGTGDPVAWVQGDATGVDDERVVQRRQSKTNEDAQKAYSRHGVFQHANAETQVEAGRAAVNADPALRRSLGLTYDNTLLVQASDAHQQVQEDLGEFDVGRAKELETAAEKQMIVHSLLKESEQRSTVQQLLSELAVARNQPKPGREMSSAVAAVVDRNAVALGNTPITSDEANDLPDRVFRNSVIFRMQKLEKTEPMQAVAIKKARERLRKQKLDREPNQADINAYWDDVYKTALSLPRAELTQYVLDTGMMPTRAEIIGGDVLQVYKQSYKFLHQAAEARKTPSLSQRYREGEEVVANYLAPENASKEMGKALFNTAFQRLTIPQQQAVLHSPAAMRALNKYLIVFQEDANVSGVHYKHVLGELKRLRTNKIKLTPKNMGSFGSAVLRNTQNHIFRVMDTDPMWALLLKEINRYSR